MSPRFLMKTGESDAGPIFEIFGQTVYLFHARRKKVMEFETLASGYGLLEGPRTDEQNRLYFSDVRGGGVFRRDPDGRIETLIPERKSVGGIALNEGGGLVITGAGLAYWDETTARIRNIFTEWEG